MNNSILIAHSIISKIVTKFCSLPPFMENKLVLLCQHCCWKRRHFRALFGLSDIGRLQGSRQICLRHDSLTFAMVDLEHTVQSDQNTIICQTIFQNMIMKDFDEFEFEKNVQQPVVAKRAVPMGAKLGPLGLCCQGPTLLYHHHHTKLNKYRMHNAKNINITPTTTTTTTPSRMVSRWGQVWSTLHC